MSNSTTGATRQESEADDKRHPSVGEEIRAVRKARRLTLKAVSATVDCSVAYLSRIERGSANLSVDLLTRIGEALGVDPKWFFPTRAGESNNEQTYVVRAENRRPFSNLYNHNLDELGYVDELLSSSVAGQFYMTQAHFPPGTVRITEPRERYVYDGEQHGVVIKGFLELTLGDDVITLNCGDSFSYPTRIPHRFRNPGTEEAIMIWAAAPVVISW
jgi:transcriptional regulator with XRE-family HTH domain